MLTHHFFPARADRAFRPVFPYFFFLPSPFFLLTCRLAGPLGSENLGQKTFLSACWLPPFCPSLDVLFPSSFWPRVSAFYRTSKTIEVVSFPGRGLFIRKVPLKPSLLLLRAWWGGGGGCWGVVCCFVFWVGVGCGGWFLFGGVGGAPTSLTYKFRTTPSVHTRIPFLGTPAGQPLARVRNLPVNC